jgi:ubiquinone/menaquinone biosynthesis C-methylase UbiE
MWSSAERRVRAAAARVHLALWRIKIRVLPRTRPRPRDLPSAGRPARAWQPPERKHTLDWGEHQARSLWDSLYARYGAEVDGRTVLDLGCSWGYLLRHLAEHHRPERLIGVDVSPLWDNVRHGWDHAATGSIEFHVGQLHELDALRERSVDLILCSSTLQYMTPELVEANLARAYSLLRPGGELLLRTRVFTSYIGADLHRTIAKPYVHLLHGEAAIADVVRASTGREPRYLNALTASTYTAIFHRAGFEAASLRRRPSSAAPDVLAEVRASIPAPEGELTCAELEARLVRPLETTDLDALAERVDTRPRSGRAAYAPDGAR